MLPDVITDSHLYSALAVAAVFAALQIGAVVVNFVLKALIRRAERRAPGGYASQVLSSVRGPAVLALVTLGFFAATFVVDQLDLPPFATITGLTSWVGNFWLVTTILMVTYAAAKVVEVAIAWYGHNVMSRTETSLDDRLLGPDEARDPVDHLRGRPAGGARQRGRVHKPPARRYWHSRPGRRTGHSANAEQLPLRHLHSRRGHIRGGRLHRARERIFRALSSTSVGAAPSCAAS